MGYILLLSLGFTIAGLLAALISEFLLCFIFYAAAATILISVRDRAGGSNPHLDGDMDKPTNTLRVVRNRPSVESHNKEEK